jgi:putative DNA primase/helicase
MLIPFDVRIPEDQRRAREDLIEEFKAEASGILKWLLLGCADWLSDGLNPPPEVLGANKNYHSEMDVLRMFIEEKCTVADMARATSADLNKAYAKWAKENNEESITTTQLGKKLGEKGFKPGKIGSARGWYGIGLLQEGT